MLSLRRYARWTAISRTCDWIGSSPRLLEARIHFGLFQNLSGFHSELVLYGVCQVTLVSFEESFDLGLDRSFIGYFWILSGQIALFVYFLIFVHIFFDLIIDGHVTWIDLFDCVKSSVFHALKG